MVGVPTLAEVTQDRAQLLGLPFGALWELSLEAGRLQAAITTAMLAAQSTSGVTTMTADRLLTIPEAAERLRIHPDTMKQKLRTLPYNAAAVVLARNCVRVSAHRLEQILLDRGLGARRKAVSA